MGGPRDFWQEHVVGAGGRHRLGGKVKSSVLDLLSAM